MPRVDIDRGAYIVIVVIYSYCTVLYCTVLTPTAKYIQSSVKQIWRTQKTKNVERMPQDDGKAQG